MNRRINSIDVARRAGVSQTTVSFVLNERTDVPIPPATRERVFQAARDLGYRRNRVAHSLVRGRTHTIGVIVPRLGSSFTAHIADGVQETLAKHNYRLLLAHTQHDPDREAREVALLLEHRVDGLICVAGEATVAAMPGWLDEIAADQIPCVIVDDRTHALRVDCVVSDDVAGARAATDHLIALGHRRVAHLAAGERNSSARDRRAGYQAALREHNLAELIAGDGFLAADVGPAVADLLDRPNPPTALFVANDYLAADVLEVLRARGVRVPDDVSLVGYGDTRVGRCLQLSTVYQNAGRLGRVAAERLLSRLAEPDLAPREIILSTNLVVRTSSSPPPP